MRHWVLCKTTAPKENATVTETIFFSPTLKGGKLFIVTSALKSQRRVRCEFGVVCFLEIDFLLPEIN